MGHITLASWLRVSDHVLFTIRRNRMRFWSASVLNQPDCLLSFSLVQHGKRLPKTHMQTLYLRAMCCVGAFVELCVEPCDGVDALAGEL